MNEIRLVHYMAERGSGEYLALLSEEETVFDYKRDGFGVHGVFYLTPHTREDDPYSLPLDRTFAED